MGTLQAGVTHIDLCLVDLAIRADIADIQEDVPALHDCRWEIGWGGKRRCSGRAHKDRTRLSYERPPPSEDTKFGG